MPSNPAAGFFRSNSPDRMCLLHVCITLGFGHETVGQNDANLEQILGPKATMSDIGQTSEVIA